MYPRTLLIALRSLNSSHHSFLSFSKTHLELASALRPPSLSLIFLLKHKSWATWTKSWQESRSIFIKDAAYVDFPQRS
ncbi:hypothetical protein HanPSC8_Chr02g0062451 [Helianthus annuus]|nr:hypothetical protein HanPSC8_Chr02g0062451 [Helianthus annuus]